MNAVALSSMTQALPEIVLALGAMVLLMLGAYRGAPTRVVSLCSIVLLIAAAVIVVLHSERQGFRHQLHRRRFRPLHEDPGLCRFGLRHRHVARLSPGRERQQTFEYPILILLSTVGMGMLISAGDLIALYLGLELMSLALYVVAASNRDSVRSTEAGPEVFRARRAVVRACCCTAAR